MLFKDFYSNHYDEFIISGVYSPRKGLFSLKKAFFLILDYICEKKLSKSLNTY